MGGRITICYPFAGDSLGGSHHSLLGLLKGLDQTRYRLLLVVEKPGGRIAEHFAEFEVVADPCPPRASFEAGRSFNPAKFLSTFGGIRRRARFLREQGVDLVHTNDGRTHATWSLAAKLAGAKLVWHHRGDPTAKGLRWLAPRVADQIVTVSRFSLPPNKGSRAAREAQVVFSPFDVDFTVDRAAMRRQLLDELALPDDTLICGYFGLYLERKRPLGFIETIRILKGMTGRPVVGVMFGQAEHPELMAEMEQRIASPELGGAVRLMGYRSPGAAWIAACDQLLVPAIDEPLGRTLVEAMVVGTPVIATGSGGNPEAILDGLGVIVPPDDPQVMAMACATLADAPPEKLAAMTERARQSACERFAARRHIAAIEAIYLRLTGQNPAA